MWARARLSTLLITLFLFFSFVPRNTFEFERATTEWGDCIENKTVIVIKTITGILVERRGY